jgi:hypothetical protein
MSTNIKKVAIYIRDISNNEENIQYQIEKSKEFVEKYQLEIIIVYIDRDNSSKQLNKMLDDIPLNLYRWILIENLNAFSNHTISSNDINIFIWEYDINIDIFIKSEMICQIGREVLNQFEKLTNEERKTIFFQMEETTAMDKFVSSCYKFFRKYKNRFIEKKEDWKY